MKHKEDILNELEELSPRLAQIKREEMPLEVPATYFAELQRDVLWQIRQEQRAAAQPETKPAPANWFAWFDFLRRPRYAVAFATLAVLLVAAIWVLAPRAGSSDNGLNPAFATLTEAEALEYIEDNVQDFDVELLAQFANLDLLEATATSGWSDEEWDDILDALLDEADIQTLEELF
jgi:hypothetical protein